MKTDLAVGQVRLVLENGPEHFLQPGVKLVVKRLFEGLNGERWVEFLFEDGERSEWFEVSIWACTKEI